MKRAGILASIALILAIPLHGQANYPRTEIFAAYAYSHADYSTIGHNLNGWGVSVTANATRYLGITADFSGGYGSETYALACPSPGCVPQSSGVSLYNLMGGPKFSYRTGAATIFAHGLAGIVSRRAAAPGNQTQFGMGVGGGADVALHGRLAYRIFQVDYIPAKQSASTGVGWQKDFRVETGIVFAFGKK
jgi:hypothetical protein